MGSMRSLLLTTDRSETRLQPVTAKSHLVTSLPVCVSRYYVGEQDSSDIKRPHTGYLLLTMVEVGKHSIHFIIA